VNLGVQPGFVLPAPSLKPGVRRPTLGFSTFARLALVAPLLLAHQSVAVPGPTPGPTQTPAPELMSSTPSAVPECASAVYGREPLFRYWEVSGPWTRDRDVDLRFYADRCVRISIAQDMGRHRVVTIRLSEQDWYELTAELSRLRSGPASFPTVDASSWNLEGGVRGQMSYYYTGGDLSQDPSSPAVRVVVDRILKRVLGQ
jgi:hypothetical protein